MGGRERERCKRRNTGSREGETEQDGRLPIHTIHTGTAKLNKVGMHNADAGTPEADFLQILFCFELRWLFQGESYWPAAHGPAPSG